MQWTFYAKSEVNSSVACTRTLLVPRLPLSALFFSAAEHRVCNLAKMSNKILH